MDIRLHKILIIWIALVGCIMTGYTQDPIHFDHITTDDGLSQSDINSIYQDTRGFMWFGTHDGLNKYDGYGFSVYKPDNDHLGNISSNLIYAITGDQNGNLWVGTTGSGLNFFDRSTGKFTQYKHDENNKESLSNDHVASIYKDRRNRLWVGTIGGLNMVDLNKSTDTLKFTHFSPEQESLIPGWERNSISTIFEDSKDQLWAGGRSGLYKLSRDTNGDLYFRLVNATIGLPNIQVQCIGEDKSGRLLIGTSNGLYCQSKNSDSVLVHRVDQSNINVLQVDNNNNIWCGSNNGLLYFNNSPGNEFPQFVNRFTYDLRSPSSITKNIIKSLYLDKTGIIWVGTNGGGVNKFDPERKQFRHIRKTLDPTSLSYDKIRSMYEDSNGTLWIGTEGGGLNMLLKDNDNDEYTGFKNFPTIFKPFALTEVQYKKKKTLFIGVEDVPGLLLLDISNPKRVVESDIISMPDVNQSVFTLLEDHQENIWIGTYGGGIHRWTYKGDDKEYDKDVFQENPSNANSISSNIIRNILEDKNKNIWFATGKGLCKLTKEEATKKHPKFVIYKNVQGDSSTISHDYILTVYESKAGDIWIGTFGGGLSKLIPSSDGKPERFVSYSEKNGLPNNVIKGILEDEEGHLWLSTNKGLSRFNPEQETFKNYDVNDGLQSNEFQELACLKRSNGEMLFGGINGFNAFYPKRIGDNTYESETVITDFMISNNSVQIGEEINGRILLEEPINDTKEVQLKYWENSFSFEFAALHYAAPQKNQFAYMLDGFDNNWVLTTADKRFATYTNLEPGMYTLKVKTSNNDGVWDKTPAELRINVIPPFWRTKIAYVIYGLLGLGLLIGFWRNIVNRTTRKHQSALDDLEKDKHEEVQRMKLEFFTNISHEFRTPLTLIKGPLEYLQKSGSRIEESVLQEQYGLMHKNTDYLLRLVNQLLDFRKMNQGKMRLVVRPSNITDFIKEVGEPFQFLAHKQQIDFTINTSNDSLITWFDHDALEKIMNNLLSNAFKFTPENGTITIDISEDKELQHVGVLKAKPDTTKRYVVIQVKDSGAGISKNKVENIFDRFYMTKDKDKRNPEGVGIGLSFVKNLVELHQGAINVISERGTGTNFIVRLPMHKQAYEDIQGISCKEDTENDYLVRSSETESFAIGINDEIVDENLSQSRSKLPVLLVVDDNADIRTFIKQALGENYTIHEAENGQHGFEVASKLIPNIILTDVLMPVMDGIKFCKKLKTTKETSHIPVLMLTAKSSQESEVEGLKTGADDYIRKPFDMDLLQLKLTNIIKHREELRKVFNRKITLKPKEVTVTSTDERFLQKAIEIVEKHMMNTDFNVEMLVKEMSHSRSNLYLKFKELTGLSSSEFIRNIRLKRAVQLLDQSDMSVKEIMYMTGFNTASYFSKCFKKQFGVVPSEYVRQIEKVKK
ncbi:hybrid sensor histidine kinase/response regulator transcription factor [Aquimarina algiphila]|uniref:hybrid sensor histidine kinase/response regulator transcription factor n=1 Tax=Aquimarina algiphila TaxID=2047982 RepID=UPI0024911C85|nr:hybrid sensor histidine kinase/response regulator transcription factor [Aquimarina algiphila]